jgi:two-component system sensor histidine kinase EvgS
MAESTLACRILVVDDDGHVCEVLSAMLELAGHTVECLRDGRQAIEKCRKDRPDLLVCDLAMPIVDGYAVIRAVRSMSSTIPILCISGGYACGAPDPLAEAVRIGATRALAKPIDMKVLHRVVAELLDEARRP